MGNYVRRLVYLANKDLENYNYVVSSIDSVRSKSLSSIYNNKSHSFHIADLKDKHILDVIFKYERPDVVIHGAYVRNEPLDELFYNNVTGTENLFECCNKYNVNKVFMLSPYDHLIHSYDEKNVNNYRKEVFYKSNDIEDKFININLPNVFGPRQGVNELVPQAIYNALNNLHYKFCDYKEEYIHVFDVCSAINSVLKYELNLQKKSATNVHYDVMHGKIMLNSNLVRKIYSLLDKRNLKFELLNNENNIDNEKMCGIDVQNINWSPEFTNNFDKALNETVDWYIKNKWIFKNIQKTHEM